MYQAFTRTRVFKSAPPAQKIGPYMELKEYIESPVDTHLEGLVTKLLDRCETVFDNMLHGFEIICPRTSAETLGATKRRQALGKLSMRSTALQTLM